MKNNNASDESASQSTHRALARIPTTTVLVDDDEDRRVWDFYRAIADKPISVAETLRLLVALNLMGGGAAIAAETQFPGLPGHKIFPLHRMGEFLSQSGQALLAESDAEIDRITTGREGSYAKLALARARYVSPVAPRAYASPEGGVALQSSTDKGTLNLIFEGDQAILARSTDDFMVQVNCQLNATSINELLDIYEFELSRIDT